MIFFTGLLSGLVITFIGICYLGYSEMKEETDIKKEVLKHQQKIEHGRKNQEDREGREESSKTNQVVVKV